jgi:transcriptional regulator with XRE-family HTH domain
MLLRHAVGSAIRRLRLERGLTLREVSRASAVSLPYLSEIERGRKEPSSEIIQTVCVVLGITLRQLMRETDVELVNAERGGGRIAPVLDLTARRREAVSDAPARASEPASAPVEAPRATPKRRSGEPRLLAA